MPDLNMKTTSKNNISKSKKFHKTKFESIIDFTKLRKKGFSASTVIDALRKRAKNE